MSTHADLTGAELHQPFPYFQPTDPGAVGVGKVWCDKANQLIKYRNDTDSGWIQVLGTTNNYSGLPNLWMVPPGSTTPQIQAIIDGAADGDTVMLANETHIQTEVIRLFHEVNLIGDPRGGSKIKIVTNIVNQFGSTMQIWVGWTVAPMRCRISNIEFEHDREAMTSPRTCCIVFAESISEFEIDHCTFTNITADCVHQWDTPGAPLTTNNISFHDNVVNEWWESVFLFLSGSCNNVQIHNNVCTTSSRNPAGGVSDPYGVDIGMENSQGDITNVVISNNTFTSTAPTGNSLGIVTAASDNTGIVHYDGISILNNTILGFNYNIAMRWMSGDPVRPSRIVVQNNTLSAGTRSLWINVFAGEAKDTLALIGNSVAPYYEYTGSANNLTIYDNDNG